MKLRTVLFGCLLAIVAAAPAQASLIVFHTSLNGATETPPVATPATGNALVTFDTVMNTLLVELNWVGLIGGQASAAHIHCCVFPGNNTAVTVPFPMFPSAVSGSYIHTFNLLDLTTYTSGFVTLNGGTAASAEAALIAGIKAGKAYVNVHDRDNPGGEIRGFLTPEPETLVLLLAGIGAVSLMRRRRKA